MRLQFLGYLQYILLFFIIIVVAISTVHNLNSECSGLQKAFLFHNYTIFFFILYFNTWTQYLNSASTVCFQLRYQCHPWHSFFPIHQAMIVKKKKKVFKKPNKHVSIFISFSNNSEILFLALDVKIQFIGHFKSAHLHVPELKLVKSVESNSAHCWYAVCHFWKGSKLFDVWKVCRGVTVLKIKLKVDNVLLSPQYNVMKPLCPEGQAASCRATLPTHRLGCAHATEGWPESTEQTHNVQTRVLSYVYRSKDGIPRASCSPGHRDPPPVLHFKMQRSVTPSLLQHANRLTEWATYTSRFQTTSVRISFSGQKTPYECICSCLLASVLSSSAVLL